MNEKRTQHRIGEYFLIERVDQFGDGRFTADLFVQRWHLINFSIERLESQRETLVQLDALQNNRFPRDLNHGGQINGFWIWRSVGEHIIIDVTNLSCDFLYLGACYGAVVAKNFFWLIPHAKWENMLPDRPNRDNGPEP